MSKKQKEYFLISFILITGVIVVLLTIIGLNLKYNTKYITSSIKEIYDNLKTLKDAPQILINTAWMAYYGSIITLCSTLCLFVLGGILLYDMKVMKRDILTKKTIILSIVLSLVILAFGLASIITAANITSITWTNNHYPII